MRLAVLEALNAARRDKRPAVLITDLKTGAQRLVIDPSALGPEERQRVERALRTDRLQLHGERAFHPYNPGLRMIIVGAVHIAQVLVPMARLAGYDVIVVDPRRAFARAERFEGVTLHTGWPAEAFEEIGLDSRTAVVVLTHDPKIDDPAIALSVESPAFYVGALGSRRTQAARRARFQERGIELEGRLRAPIGLPIGGRSPAEIAVSVLAEVTQVLHEADR